MVLTVPDGEEQIFEWIQKYLLNDKNFNMVSPEQNMVLTFPGLKIDLYKREVWTDGGMVVLTELEFRLLLFLAKSPGRTFTYQQIYEAVWEEEYAYEKGNIMSHIRHIREKIEVDPKNPVHIENVRGVGYRFKTKAFQR